MLKHGPERRVPLDRRPLRPRGQSPEMDLLDVLGLSPLRPEKQPVRRVRPQLADDALEVIGGRGGSEAARPQTPPAYHQARRDRPPAPPMKKLITNRSAAMMARIKSQWIV